MGNTSPAIRLEAPAIAAILRDIASALKLAGESRFRIHAYERGADAIESFTGDIDRWIEEDRLTDLPGIGEKLAAVIGEIRATGTAKVLDHLTRDLPEGALELARGPKLSMRAMRTVSNANIRDPEALRAAAKAGTLRLLPGFSAKTEARILATMEKEDARRGRLILRDALQLAANVTRFLRGQSDAVTIEVVGDVRRGLEVVNEVALLVSSATPDAVLARFERYSRFVTVDTPRALVRRGRLLDGVQVCLHAVLPEARAAAMQRLTGSDLHNSAFDRAARRAHMFVDETGAYEIRDGSRRPIKVISEEALYKRASLQYVPPTLRDGEGEVEKASRHRLPTLIEVGDIRGMVHCHTDYSDGRHTIEAMARAAQDRGMTYITITDHSPTAHYANGVEIDRLHQQWDDIARAQESLSIRILRGTESDILKDGALDYPDAILEKLDVVIASIHNRYSLDSAAMTHRIACAIRHPLFKIWGHAFGRLLLHRPPVECDVDAILDIAAESNVAIELNGDPYRLDMEPRWAKRARARGIKFVVSVDAHSARELDNVALGVTLACRAGLTANDVLNTFETEAFIAAVQPRRQLPP